MGDRANVAIKQWRKQEYVVLYTHWGGESLPEDVRKALERGERWGDEPYLARIIFDGMMPVSHHGGTTAYGISTSLGDNEYPVIVIDCDNQKVKLVTEKDFPDDSKPILEWSFEEYVAQKEATWPNEETE